MLFFAFYVISNNGRPGLLQTGQKIQHLAGHCFLPGGRMYADGPQLLPQNTAQCLLQCFLFPAPQDRSRHKRRFLSFRHSLQDLPRLPLFRVLETWPERKAGPLFHACPRTFICSARRSKPAALIRLSCSGIIRHKRSPSRTYRVTTLAPPPSITTGIALRSNPASIAADSKCSVYVRPCCRITSRTFSSSAQGSPLNTRSICASVTDSPMVRRTCSLAPSRHRIMPHSRLRQVSALGTALSSRIRSTVQPPMSMSRTEGSFWRSSGWITRAEYPCGNSFTSSMATL